LSCRFPAALISLAFALTPVKTKPAHGQVADVLPLDQRANLTFVIVTEGRLQKNLYTALGATDLHCHFAGSHFPCIYKPPYQLKNQPDKLV
jgi:hypothetical protein